MNISKKYDTSSLVFFHIIWKRNKTNKEKLDIIRINLIMKLSDSYHGQAIRRFFFHLFFAFWVSGIWYQMNTHHLYDMSDCESDNKLRKKNRRNPNTKEGKIENVTMNLSSQLSYYLQFVRLLHVTLPSPPQIVILSFVLVTLWATTTRTSEQRKWWKNKVLSFSVQRTFVVALLVK